MIRAAIIDNGIVGLRDCFISNDKIQYQFLPSRNPEKVDFTGYNLLIVPNGSDQIAMLRMKEKVRQYLHRGGTLFCFDGWFTNWLPGNQWVMDNSKKTIDTRYTIKEDRYGLFKGIDVDAFNFSNGISGWWACGYIEAAPKAEIILEDTWNRPIMVLDETSTPGRIFMTASGPLGDFSYATTDDDKSIRELGKFYQQLLKKLVPPETRRVPATLPPIGLIFNGVWSHYTFARAPKYRNLFRLLYIHDLKEEDLKGLKALAIPFQSDQKTLGENKELIYRFLANGNKVFVEGDSSADWLDAAWEDRPVNNFWWVKTPNNPPVSITNYEHPIYQGLTARHACWHTHGVYTNIPDHADIVQTNAQEEIISWETKHYGGTLFATTLDPIVEHGVQQITHLDNYVDKLTKWLCGVQPNGHFKIPKEDYGIKKW